MHLIAGYSNLAINEKREIFWYGVKDNVTNYGEHAGGIGGIWERMGSTKNLGEYGMVDRRKN